MGSGVRLIAISLSTSSELREWTTLPLSIYRSRTLLWKESIVKKKSKVEININEWLLHINWMISHIPDWYNIFCDVHITGYFQPKLIDSDPLHRIEANINVWLFVRITAHFLCYKFKLNNNNWYCTTIRSL